MKLRTLISVVALFLMMEAAFSQTLVTQAKPFKGNNWGYINQSGEYIISPQYRKCFKFSEEGYATVLDEKSKQYQFINLKGEVLNTDIKSFKLKEVFGMDVKGFNSGLVAIRVGDKWGYLDLQGKEAVKATFDKASEFNEGYASAQRAGVNFIIDKNGKETEVTDPSVLTIKDFSEGLAPFETKDKKEGFIDPNGKIVVAPVYTSVGYFSNGLAWVKTENNKIGYINTKGEWAIQPQFVAGKNFEAKSGLARVKAADKWQYVDQSGNVKTLNDSETFEDFSEGLCAGKKGGKVGFYDSSGTWVIEPQFEAVRDFKNGFAAAKMGGKWGMIDRTGKWTIEPNFSGIKDMELVK